MLKNTEDSYGSLTKFFHWVTALGIIAQFALVYIREYTPKEAPIHQTLMAVHKSLGMSLLFIIAAFIIWQLTNAKPKLPAGTRKIEKILAYSAQGLLILGGLGMAISGYVFVTAYGRSIAWFNVFNWPMLITASDAIGEKFRDYHTVISYVMIAAFVAHIAGNIKHHFILKNNVVKRMLPW